MSISARRVVSEILDHAADDPWSFEWFAEFVREAVGDPPEDWTADPPRVREHPDYVFAAARSFLQRGLLTAGYWEGGRDGRFVAWNKPLDSLMAQMRTEYDAVPRNRPLLHGDVADFELTALGRQMHLDSSAALDDLAAAIEQEWLQIDKRYERTRPADSSDA